jgi:hypothetical protein
MGNLLGSQLKREALRNQDRNRRDGMGQPYELLSTGRMQHKTSVVKIDRAIIASYASGESLFS